MKEETIINKLNKMGFEVKINIDSDNPYQIINRYDEETYVGKSLSEAYLKLFDRLKQYKNKYLEMYEQVDGLKYSVTGEFLINDLFDDRVFDTDEITKVETASNHILHGINMLENIVESKGTSSAREVLVKVLYAIANEVYTPQELDRLYSGDY